MVKGTLVVNDIVVHADGASTEIDSGAVGALAIEPCGSWILAIRKSIGQLEMRRGNEMPQCPPILIPLCVSQRACVWEAWSRF